MLIPKPDKHSIKKACKRIFKIKKRSKEKKLPIIVANLKMAKEYACFNKDALKLAKAFWPVL